MQFRHPSTRDFVYAEQWRSKESNRRGGIEEHSKAESKAESKAHSFSKSCPARILRTIIEEARHSPEEDENEDIFRTGRTDVKLEVMHEAAAVSFGRDKAVIKFHERKSDGEFMLQIRIWGREEPSMCARVQDLAFWLDEKEGVVYMEAHRAFYEAEGLTFCMVPIHGTEDLALFKWWAGRVGSLY